MTIFFRYRFVFLNLIVALLFYFIHDWLLHEAKSLDKNKGSIAIFVFTILMLLSETIGVILKIPELRKPLPNPIKKQSFLLFPLKILLGFMLSTAIFGRIVLSGIYAYLILISFSGKDIDKISQSDLSYIILIELPRAIFILYLLFWLSENKTKKEGPKNKYYNQVDFAADILLTLQSAISYTLIWSFAINSVSIDFNGVLNFKNIMTAVALFSLLYLPCNLYHFYAHLKQKVKEINSQFLLYWLSFILLIASFVLPAFKFW
jgi:hypothetical protein